MKYKASFDFYAKISTAVYFLCLICLAIIQYKQYFNVIAPIIILLFLLIISYLASPKYYAIEENSFQIKRPIATLDIKFDDISSITVPGSGIHLRRWTFGSVGIFGYNGKYYNTEIDDFTMYATKSTNQVLITTKDDKKYVVTPDDLEMAEQLKRRITA